MNYSPDKLSDLKVRASTENPNLQIGNLLLRLAVLHAC